MKKLGFTLIETFIAITILIIAILGPFELARRSIASATVSQNRITSFYLAQEAIEYIRNERDNNFLLHNPWLQNLDSCFGIDGCYVDVHNSNQIFVCVGECPKMRYDNSVGYNYLLGEDTIFTRTVKIKKNIGGATGDDEAKVSVTVSWRDKIFTKTIILEENIYNWR